MKWTKKIFRGWRRAAWGVGVLIAAVILIWVVLDIASGIKLRRAIADWQDAGLSMDVREVVPPDVPPEENAAVILNHVSRMRPPRYIEIDGQWIWTEPFELRDRRLNELEKRAIEIGDEILLQLAKGQLSSGLVDELKAALDEPTVAYKRQIARQAVTYDRFDAYLDYELGAELLLPHVGPFRQLAKLLLAEAVLSAVEGRWSEAYEAVTVTLQLGDLLADEHLIISQLTRRAIQSITLEKVETFLQIRPQDSDRFQRLHEVLFKSQESHMNRATMVEAVQFTDYLYRKLERGEFAPSELVSSEGVSFSWMDKGIFRPWHKADFAIYMNVNRERITSLQEAGDSMDSHRIMREWEKDFVSDLPWYALAARKLIPSVSRIYLRDAMISARLAFAQAALAANAYRAASGDWPETLEDLVPVHLPEILRDPFDHEPLRYDRTEKRIVIYSVGPNMTDDGGEWMEKVRPDESGDIVWVLAEGESE